MLGALFMHKRDSSGAKQVGRRLLHLDRGSVVQLKSALPQLTPALRVQQ